MPEEDIYESHLQKVMVEILQLANQFVKAKTKIVDTHSNTVSTKHDNFGFDIPRLQPDCVSFSAAAVVNPVRQWNKLLQTFEIKMKSKDFEDCQGAQINLWCAAYKNDPSRCRRVSVNISVTHLEVMVGLMDDRGGLRIIKTNPQLFSISAESPGFLLLLRVLAIHA